MGDDRISTPVPDGGSGIGKFAEFGLLERLRHAVTAVAVALVMLVGLFLEPVDWVLWLVQSRIAEREASQGIVFVSTERDMADPGTAHLRENVARALDELERQGVGKVYLNIAFDKKSTPQADAALTASFENLGVRLVHVGRVEGALDGAKSVRESLPQFVGDRPLVYDEHLDNLLGISWNQRYAFDVKGKRVQSLGASLGRSHRWTDDTFPIDYSFAIDSIPVVEMNSLLANASSSRSGLNLAGKTIVVGRGSWQSGSTVSVPGRRVAPESLVSIYAAETLRSGRTGKVPGWAALSIAFVLLAAIAILARNDRVRRTGYATMAASVPIVLVISAIAGVRIEASYAIAALLVYGVLRSRSRWKHRVALVNQDTGLPTLRALEESADRRKCGGGHLVIAKIHGFERVVKLLSTADQADYVLKIVDRLRAADTDLTVYCDGHYLGFLVATDDRKDLVEHLEGLRAIFAAPIVACGHSIDVGITFGAVALDESFTRRVPAALAAVEETTEAHQPVQFAEAGSPHDHLWDISLRSRIDDAMKAGEIYCVYQPKVDIRSGATTGVEALVRWQDPARGFISPLHFIQQCEKAGRMEHLTRYVLQSACSAGQLLHFSGQRLSMSVNISATMLGDMNIVGLLRNVLQATKFDPGSLILEVTETARITDLATAASILHELKALGPRISIDDFGVGAANFETFFELPFDELKIDRLFIANLGHNPKARAIVASIVSMGAESQISIVAEGAESAEEIEILNEIGCSQVQGFALSRPVSLSTLLENLGFHEGGRLANMV